MTKPFTPADLTRSDRLQPWRRAITAKLMKGGWDTEEIIERLWGEDPRQVEAIKKAAVSPASTPVSGWASQIVAPSPVGEFLRSLRPRSAAAQLFTTPLTMGGSTTMALPRVATDWPEPAFVSEGGAIPAYSGSFANATLGPVKKLAAIAAITSELEQYSAESAEAIVTALMDDAASRALDAAVFADVAASASRPAGLLNGVTPITAWAGGGVAAMLADIQALVGAIVAAGGGSSIMLFANPVQAVALNIWAANGVGYPVIPAPSLAEGTIIAIEQNAIASAFAGLPSVDTSKEAVIQYDTAPAALIGTAGSPNVVAAPTMSAFQHDLLVMRLTLPCAWTSRAPGMVQVIESTSW